MLDSTESFYVDGKINSMWSFWRQISENRQRYRQEMKLDNAKSFDSTQKSQQRVYVPGATQIIFLVIAQVILSIAAYFLITKSGVTLISEPHSVMSAIFRSLIASIFFTVAIYLLFYKRLRGLLSKSVPVNVTLKAKEPEFVTSLICRELILQDKILTKKFHKILYDHLFTKYFLDFSDVCISQLIGNLDTSVLSSSDRYADELSVVSSKRIAFDYDNTTTLCYLAPSRGSYDIDRD